MATAVKICGITRIGDALAAARAGAHAIGVVLYEKSPRYVTPTTAREIVASLPPFVTAVALLVDPEPGEVRRIIDTVRPQLLQFHGDESPQFCEGFGLPYIKAVRVRPETDLLQCARLYEGAKGLLLDTFVAGNQGGTGKRFDWKLVPADMPGPVVLAGGLTPENVAQAIMRLQPWAVDVSSGVESSPGVKDAARIAAFIRGVRNADV